MTGIFQMFTNFLLENSIPFNFPPAMESTQRLQPLSQGRERTLGTRLKGLLSLSKI